MKNTTTTTTMKEDKTMTTTMKEDTTTMKNNDYSVSLFSATFDGMSAIAYKPVMRSNERVLVYDIRCALIDNDCASLLSLVKAWYVMAKKPDMANMSAVDARVVDLSAGLIKLCYTGKRASVKERKDGAKASVDVIGTGRIKAWLYTLSENRFDMVAQAGGRPAEKENKRKASEKKSIRIDGVTYDMDTIRGLIATIK